MTILDELAEYARVRVAEGKKRISPEEMRRQAEQCGKGGFVFEGALKKRQKKDKEPRFICECKKASPSRGLISEAYPYRDIARDYMMAGADAISVLTEPKWFLGNDTHLAEIADTVMQPCLRKDFTVDAYMIYEAKTLGAAAVLLICALLETEQIREYIGICDSLGMSALVEAHDEAEVIKAIDAGARIVGVNNRNLRDFTVDTGNALRYRKLLPEEVIYVAESGIKNRADVVAAKKAGVDALLVGETMMCAADKRHMLDELRGYHEEEEEEASWREL